MSNTRQALGHLALREDNKTVARQWLEQAHHLYEAVGERMGEANCYKSFGMLTGEAAWFEKAIALHTEIDDSYSVVLDKFEYGRVLAEQNNWITTAEMFADARDIWQQISLTAYAQEAERQWQRAMLGAATSAPMGKGMQE